MKKENRKKNKGALKNKNHYTRSSFKIKEVKIKQSFSCNYAPGCDCASY